MDGVKLFPYVCENTDQKKKFAGRRKLARC